MGYDKTIQQKLEAQGVPSHSFSYPAVPPPPGPDGKPQKPIAMGSPTGPQARPGAPGTAAKSEGQGGLPLSLIGSS